MWGGASTTFTLGTLHNGNDIIEGGAGNDQMWGDTQFVFGGGTVVAGDDNLVFVSGDTTTGSTDSDIIWDFNGGGAVGGDVIEMDGYASADFDPFIDVPLYNSTTGQYETVSGTLISSGDQQIYVVGQTVNANDVLFV
jgi:hypothetical protein